MKFRLVSSFKPTGDQPEAIKQLTQKLKEGSKELVLLGVTGSGKTFTIANVIEKLNIPTLVISHNKTLAAQLYQEFREFFPDNAVSYFISYYDFYQPEAYIPQSNTYIEKEVKINDLIDKLRLQATSNILSRQDVLVVASVSCIYNIGKPENYEQYTLVLKVGDTFRRKELFSKLAMLQYTSSQFDFKRSTFRDRGNNVDVYLSYEDVGLRIVFSNDLITALKLIDPLTGRVLNHLKTYVIYPAKHYLMAGQDLEAILKNIRSDLEREVRIFREKNKLVEAERLEKRVNNDLEIIREVGYVNGIENYSRYFDRRRPGEAPYTLLDYFQYRFSNNWLLVIDESHMTLPQLRGMYNGDYGRKKNLIDYGFRMQAAYDNRPLKFDEFLKKIPQTIYVSATPADWETRRATSVIQQLVRPTGIPDPKITIRKVETQIDDLLSEIDKRVKKKERVLVTTLTKRIAEDLSFYLKEKGINAHYLHSDIKTLERSDVLDALRKGEFDVLIGINLLREGLDLPEVSLVAILDADKEGFLRSKISLIQTMGRAARNSDGQVIIYTDRVTKSIKEAVLEVERRRQYQLQYNQKHGIVPKTIHKPIRNKLVLVEESDLEFYFGDSRQRYSFEKIEGLSASSLTAYDRKKIIARLKRQMKQEAEALNFELAAKIRDKIRMLEGTSRL